MGFVCERGAVEGRLCGVALGGFVGVVAVHRGLDGGVLCVVGVFGVMGSRARAVSHGFGGRGALCGGGAGGGVVVLGPVGVVVVFFIQRDGGMGIAVCTTIRLKIIRVS